MRDQIGLFDRPLPIPDPPEPPPIEPARENNPEKKDLRAETAAWIARNPQGYALFERFALELAGRGRTFGVKLIAERVRWECILQGYEEQDGYKINNNYSAYIARKLVADHPQLRDHIRFRKTVY